MSMRCRRCDLRTQYITVSRRRIFRGLPRPTRFLLWSWGHNRVLTSQGLLKLMWGLRDDKPLLRLFIDVVKRLWLIVPVESIVESISSILKEVFGTHRIRDPSVTSLKSLGRKQQLAGQFGAEAQCYAAGGGRCDRSSFISILSGLKNS